MTAPLPPMHHETHDRELLNMTAPLPPLPPLTCDHTTGFAAVWTEDQMRDFAKLSVREALERVAQETIKAANEQKNWSLSAVLAAFSIRVRAMLKDYE